MKRLSLIIIMSLIFAGCKKHTVPSPAKAFLNAPIQNAVCTTGDIKSVLQSDVTFQWNNSANTDNYDLYLKNLLTGEITIQNTTQTQLKITLFRNTPYSWYVISKSTKTGATSQSDTWKFYNSGPGAVSYAPFPADITAPGFAQTVTATTGTVNLTWTGTSVVAGTISGYDVYFGTTQSPTLYKSAVTDMFLNNVMVTSKTTYYWKVITKDFAGNSSDSGLYQFNVN